MRLVRATIAAVLALTVAMGCSPSEPAKTDRPEAVHEGPVLDGTYRMDLDGNHLSVNGKPVHAPPAPSMFAFRSACSPSGCVATGTLLQGNDIHRAANFTVILDYVRGDWRMVTVNSFPCDDGAATDGILAWVLKPGPTGSLAGTYYGAHAGGVDCAAALHAPMTMTRVGEVDPAVPVADPHTIPALAVSAPEGFRGNYKQIDTYRGPGAPPSTDAVEIDADAVDITTMCVRNTDQCWALAAAHYGGKTAEWPLAFADGKWSVLRRASGHESCPDHTTATTVLHADYLMPPPVLNPMPRLAGAETLDFNSPTTPCAGSFTYSTVLERTG
ncbi:MAG: hypothetical protein ABWY93_03470 [Mycobacterium sp.]